MGSKVKIHGEQKGGRMLSRNTPYKMKHRKKMQGDIEGISIFCEP
jgi:hypothetical protein